MRACSAGSASPGARWSRSRRRRAHGREILLSEALRPAAATDAWCSSLAAAMPAAALDRAMATITAIEAANAEEEALVIAVALREALTVPTRIAALVTPDRALARRVAVTLQRWNASADDSGGDQLAETAAGVFARLVAEAALGGFAAGALLALLKHPLARFGAEPGAHRRAVATLERAMLRGPRPRPGSSGLAHALASVRGEIAKLRHGEASEIHQSDPRATLHDAALAGRTRSSSGSPQRSRRLRARRPRRRAGFRRARGPPPRSCGGAEPRRRR